MTGSDLEQSIFRTVAWFSLFEYPVTAFEVWKWLIEPGVAYRLQEVMQTLRESSWLQEKLESQDGFFILKGEGANLSTRHLRFIDAARKYHRLQRAIFYLSRLPNVRTIAACNTLAWSNTRPASDIDLFIVVKRGCVWLTRLLAVAPFAFFGRRPAAGVVDPFCFSFFASETRSNFSDLRLSKRDIYLAQWIRCCVPLVNDGAFEELLGANGWVSRCFPNSFGVRVAVARRLSPFSRGSWRGLIAFECIARWIQRSRLPHDLQELANKDTRVIVTDDMLKFHPNDRRAEFAAKLEAIQHQTG